MPAIKDEKEGENPGLNAEEVLTTLLISLCTNLMNKLFTYLFTNGQLRKWLSGNGSE